jgi:hypothetical protein
VDLRQPPRHPPGPTDAAEVTFAKLASECRIIVAKLASECRTVFAKLASECRITVVLGHGT